MTLAAIRFIALVGVITMTLIAGVPGQAQSIDNESGRFFIDIYTPEDYGASRQNWSAAQRENGLLYFGNSNGVLEYDGSSWRLIKDPNLEVVRSLALGQDGRIYVGARQELGFLAPDSIGNMIYHSLLDQIAEEDREFNFIWTTLSYQDAIFFMGENILYRWRAGRFKIWRFSSLINDIFLLQDTLYVQIGKEGLFRMESDSLVMVPGTDLFADMRLHSMIPKGDDAFIAITMEHGLFHCYLPPGSLESNTLQASCTPFNPEHTDQFKELRVLRYSSLLPDSTIAIPTLRGGVALLNQSGEILRTLKENQGLPTNTITFTFVDQEGQVWLGIQGGIARLNQLGSASFFDNDTGLAGVVTSIARYQGRLYVNTVRGFFSLNPAQEGSEPAFVSVKSTKNSECFSLLSTSNALIAGCLDRLVDVERDEVLLNLGGASMIYALALSRFDSTRLYLGLEKSLGYASYRNGKWHYDGAVLLDHVVRSIFEDDSRGIWAAGSGQIHRIIPGRDPEESVVEKFGPEHGLPPSSSFKLQRLRSGLIVLLSKDQGLYQVRSNADSVWFEPIDTFDFSAPNQSIQFENFAEDGENRLWINAGPASRVGIPQDNETYSFHASLLSIDPSTSTEVMYGEEDGVMWSARSDKLTRIKSRLLDRSEVPASTLIRRISTQNDSVLYGGEASGLPSSPVWTEDIDNLRFEFAVPRYEVSEKNQYRSRLKGAEKEWSKWSNESFRDYTNLSEGTYTFHVEGRDVLGQLSKPATFSFSILPPWYRTAWAYVLWIILGSACIIGSTLAYNTYRTRKLKATNRILEEKINERTESLRVALKEANIANETQARFLANVSHELRTPLTLIMAPLAELANQTLGKQSDEALKFIHIAQRSAGRLFHMISDVLDMSRIEEGHRISNKRKNDLTALLRYLYDSFSILANQKDITYSFHGEQEPIYFSFDADQLERAFVNLLSNAFKYTPRGGAIRLLIKQTASNQVQVSVKDNGIGIPEKHQNRIFERFYRVDHHSLEPGTGIGLAYAKEIVDLHGGTITIDSELDFGSTFTITLPLVQEEDISPIPTFQAATPMYVDTEVGQLLDPYDPLEDVDSEVDIDIEQASILVVDDNADVRLYMKERLTPYYNVIQAKDGMDALGKATKYMPDVIVCDVMMPVLDGIAFTHRLKNNPEIGYIPVILLTANTSSKLPGLEEGADDYLTKPFDMKELRLRIRNLISSRKKLGNKILKPAFTLDVPAIDVTPQDNVFISSVQKIIEEHMGDSAFGVGQLAERTAHSRTTLHRRINKITDMGPGELIRLMRLQRASQLLEAQAGSISEIAYSVGFKNVSYFSTSFSKHFGKTPSAYQREKGHDKV